MKVPRLNYEPGLAVAFYEESLGALGALCERTWHDRLQVVAEGRAATLWNREGSLHSQELSFAPADATVARDAHREVFPGCPLTFRISELLRFGPIACDKAVLREASPNRLPEEVVLEKLWRAQFPSPGQWRLAGEFKADWHFSLLALVRCEIQAIDQHWSLHRIGLSFPQGEPDDLLAGQIPFLEADKAPPAINWPPLDPSQWWSWLEKHLPLELAPDIAEVQTRQEQYLRREVRRIDEYFAQYEEELARRSARGAATAKLKAEERLQAAKLEHVRRRNDQVSRHEIVIVPHLDALLMTAEPAWQGIVEISGPGARRSVEALYVPRARKWVNRTLIETRAGCQKRL